MTGGSQRHIAYTLTRIPSAFSQRYAGTSIAPGSASASLTMFHGQGVIRGLLWSPLYDVVWAWDLS